MTVSNSSNKGIIHSQNNVRVTSDLEGKLQGPLLIEKMG